ncbi:uncharacterized protein LOC110447753 [Mizuhopecten yessoensis]|uniref:G-protein coupled receptor 101 n=1 Tax=Mizuhopecten yessoensis TaxID=6573 RepID=A0A210QUN9_MIZYE|nr:uncharacterized protein LOC110447753 [Mizuhopecten yessoensis]OWF52447.1 G-protein coupled receptor 101 [Mizuhopecten yessoensis]
MSSNIGTSIGGAFINWFSKDVMPKFAAAVDLTILLVSIILNILLIVMFKKKRLLLDPANRLVFQLIIVDILAWLFILIPGAVVALRGQWDLTMPVCYAQAILVNWIYLVMFGFIITLFIERTVLVKNPKLHGKVFGKVSKVTVVSLLIWGVDLGIAAIPMSGWSPIDYDFYHGSCIVYHESNIYYVIILFMSGIGAAILSGVICIPIILKSRKAKIHKENTEAAKIEAELRRKRRLEAIAEEKKEMEAENINLEKKSEKSKLSAPVAKHGWTDSKQPSGKADKKPKNKQMKNRKRRARTPKRRDKRLLEDDYEDPDFHLTVTYMIMGVVLLLLWLPYFIVLFRHAGVNDSEFWRGYYSVTVIVALFSFCIKPIIYLSHNRHMQEKTKNTLPENVVERASALRMSFSDVVDKLDKIVFKSPRSQPSIQTTVKAHSIAMKWMKKGKGELVKPEVNVVSDSTNDTNDPDKSKLLTHGDKTVKSEMLNNSKVNSSKSPVPAAVSPNVATVTSLTPHVNQGMDTATENVESTLVDIEENEQVTESDPVIHSRSPEYITRM